MLTHRRLLGAASACAPLALALGALGAETLAGVLRLVVASLAPGLLLVGWRGGRDGPSGPAGGAWDAALALALSPFLLALPTAVLVFGAGWSLGAASEVCFWTSAALAGAACALGRAPASPEPARRRPARRWLLAALPTLAIVALALVVQLPAGVRLSYHGLFHADVVAQIATGTLPPENPAMAGEPLRYYWLFHWLLAILHELTGFSVLWTSPWVNLVSLLVYVAAGHALLLRFCTPGLAALGAPVLGFSMNLLFPVVFGVRAALGGWEGGYFHWPFQLFSLGTLAGDPRLVTLLGKFLNMNGFPLGLALWSALVVEMLPRAGRRPRLGVVFVLLGGALFFHIAAAVAAYAALSLAWLAVSVPDLRRTSLAALLRANLPMAAAFVAALVVASPYLVLTLWQPADLPQPETVLSQSLVYNAGGVLLSATPLLLVVAVGLVRALAQPTGRFLWVATAVPLALGLLLALPDGNQYKLVQLASFPGGALLFWLLRDWRHAAAAFAVVFALGVAAHAITAFAYRGAGMAQRLRYAGDGAYLAIPGEPARDRALRWLRENTPPDAVVVARPVRRGASPVTSVSGRGIFVLQTLPHFRGPDYAERMGAVQSLFSQGADAAPAISRIAALLDRPLYVLLVEEPPALNEKLGRAPEWLERVYGDGSTSVWAVVRHDASRAASGE